jgi:hypothetical protein
MPRIADDAVHRADLATLGGVVVSHAFRAKGGVDHVDLRAYGDGVVGTLRFTDIAVDAFIGNQ